ncbi:hypothetical protein HE1_00582 [Holospora elegans E1]|uniref:Uncharacterized protein n=1 Tax=Holospora elegans E1 TaxID=1427503 RepID=A0A023DXT9_9PROT|nr:hypothetical protein HE1_00582 [Holospora elegans E1]
MFYPPQHCMEKNNIFHTLLWALYYNNFIIICVSRFLIKKYFFYLDFLLEKQDNK